MIAKFSYDPTFRETDKTNNNLGNDALQVKFLD
jgi:hypothetical protein